MHVECGRSLWQATRHQPLAPVVVSVLAGPERLTLRQSPPRSSHAFLGFHAQRIARVLTEAYVQDGLLSFAELQWIFLVSTGTVSRLVDHYQRTHRVLLPCPGTVLDMGRMLTHKDVIVRLNLEGHTVLEIARRTYHDPRSVDAYLKAFDAVLILHLYGLSPALMARVLGKGSGSRRGIPPPHRGVPQGAGRHAPPPSAARGCGCPLSYQMAVDIATPFSDISSSGTSATPLRKVFPDPRSN
jgi:hypothetical protein